MYTLKVQNDRSELLNISADSNYAVLDINGLSPMPAEISTTAAVGYDGSIYTNGRCDKRNITMSIAIRGDIEQSRQTLYSYFTPKRNVRLFFKNTNRDVYIDAYVETVEIDLFSEMQVANISLICPMPYFTANQENEYTLTSDSDNKLSVTIEGGEAESGCIFDIKILGDNRPDISPVVIENTTSGEKIEIDYQFPVVFGLGKVYINTTAGSKQAVYDNLGNKTNIMSSLEITNHEWVNLHTGENEFKVYCKNSGESIRYMLSATMTAYKYYVGV